MRLILLFCTVFSLTSLGQSSFPDNWIGDYDGQMILANMGRPNDTIAVDFTLEEVIKDSVWTHKMHYYSEKWGDIIKDYLIVAKRKENTVDYYLDEQNGIVMELTYMNDCFYGMYEVMGMIYTTSFRKHGDQLFFELYAASLDKKKLSATEPDENGEVIKVESPKTTLVQSVMLSRKK